MKTTRLSLMFPYRGGDDAIFEKLVKLIGAARTPSTTPIHSSSRKPILVVNRDTVDQGGFDRFLDYCAARNLKDPRELCEVLMVYSVDTCQMWLAGWGKVLDDNIASPQSEDEAVLQLPGDLRHVRGNFDEFISKLNIMLLRLDHADFVLGDFDIEQDKAKHLIDIYGTYPMVFTWFPEVAAILRSTGIKRPRSEFFAASIPFLQSMLGRKKFAYELTLAFLIYAIDDHDKGQQWRVGKVDLGEVSDFGELRGFRESMDQVERTERLLRVLWRALRGGDTFDVDEYERRDVRSTAVREAAMVTWREMFRIPHV